MAEEYVSKEVFNARMDRMEALLEKTLIEVKSEVGQLRLEMKESNTQLRSEMDQIRSEMKENNTQLRGEMNQLRAEVKSEVGQIHTEIRRLDSRIDSVQTMVYWGFAVMGLLLSFTTLAPALLEFIRGLRKPSVTFEDVRQMINAAVREARLEGK